MLHIVYILIGCALIIGAYRRWPILIDPPHSFKWRVLHGNLYGVEQRYGVTGAAICAYSIGLLLIVLCLIDLWFFQLERLLP